MTSKTLLEHLCLLTESPFGKKMLSEGDVCLFLLFQFLNSGWKDTGAQKMKIQQTKLFFGNSDNQCILHGIHTRILMYFI